MKFTNCFLQGAALALLAGLGSTFGLSNSKLVRDFHDAAMMGINPEMVLKPEQFQAEMARIESAAPVAETIDMPTDHTNSKVGTYKHRFWINELDYKPGGPVFVFDCGEAAGQRYANNYLFNETSFFRQLTRKFNGIGLVFEHRYYGESTPFPISIKTPPEHFKYLNNDQALADLPYLAKSFKRDAFPKSDLRPTATPWVMVGGSYPGMRAAFTRDRYPETIFASWASSAPVQAQIDMAVYYEQVYRGLVSYGWGNCTKDLHAAYRYIDRQLSRKDTAAALKKMFLGEGAEESSNGDFTAGLITAYAGWQSQGADGLVGQFCNWLEIDPKTNKTAPAEGWAPTKGDKAMAERFAAWPPLASLVNANGMTNCKQTDKTKPLECKLDKPSEDKDFISWVWQYCSEWGYYQGVNFPEHAILSRYQTNQWNQEYCYRQFPTGVKSGYLPREPQTHKTNRATKGWHMRPSNVYWSGGQFDPWKTLSPLSTEDFAPRIEVSKEIPKCNVSTGPKKIFGYEIPNAQHVYDFRTYFKPGQVSRQLFNDALEAWLPCFGKK
uniref:Family S28 serine peptidase n=1 Tax=Onygena corvina TaxID=180788 RepID=A0A0B4VLW1_9EURO|nr:family S28 serine peptidase [Onygena corvina]